MMINFQGNLISEEAFQLSPENRALRFGDGLFETMLYQNGVIHFYEDHYFRAMGSMCMMRMNIPKAWNMEYFYQQIIETIEHNGLLNKTANIRIQFYRKGGGKYLPNDLSVAFFIEVSPLDENKIVFQENGLKADAFYDHSKAATELSSIKTSNALIYVLASIFALENKIDQAFIFNTNKEIIESQNANIFVLKGEEAIVPSPQKGALDGIMRKQLIKTLEKEGYTIKDDKLRLYELQTADEILVTNAIFGVQYISQFQEKQYLYSKAKDLAEKVRNSAFEEPFKQ
ncbi:MAG: aminotransferase class IV [Flavobacteriales bacterium]|jgi:branched-chain amino acid aminotransferase|nr:aminotransferase class IV [Flavobacteriales bacterium]